MDTQTLPAEARIALYQERATQLRQMAKAEPLSTTRDQMLTLAEQYRCLAGSLKGQLRRRML